MLQSEYHRVPVTALAFFDNVIVSGEGNVLRAYDTTHGYILNSQQVWEENQQIHGLVVSDDNSPSLLAWGGSLIKAFSIRHDDDLTPSFQPEAHFNAPDWILHAAISPPTDTNDNKRLVAFVTAHNGLVVLESTELVGDHGTDTSQVPKPADLLVPGSNCILYSAQVSWLSPTHCLVAAGTAFGDVIIWSCQLTNSNGKLEASTTVHYTFSAHEGSVFGVQISPALEGRPRMLATCSDDRTVRIWDVSDLSSSCPSLIERQRDTGFGSEVQTATDFAPPCLAKAMGHVSRIWHVRFLDPAAATHKERPTSLNETLIASFGEDTAYIVWSLKLRNSDGDGLPYTLEQLSSKTAHTGKHIWSVAINKTGSIATGGADGGIAIHDAPSTQSLAHQILEVPRDLLPKEASDNIQNKKLQDNYRGYKFLDAHSVLCTTDFGRVLIIKLPQQNQQPAEVREISLPLAGLHNYSVVASASELGFISGSSGDVYLYDWFNDSPLRLIAKTQRKTAGLFACAIKTKYSEDDVYLLVTTVGSKQAEILKLNSQMPPNQSEEDLVKAKWRLELPDTGFITTSFTVLEMGGTSWAAVGSRSGAIAVFSIQHTEAALQVELLKPNVHGNEAVTALYADANASGVDGNQVTTEAILHSVGRDGAHAIHRLKVSNRQNGEMSANRPPTLSLIHNLPLPFGPNIEGINRTANNELWIWGFRGKSFVVYNTTTQQEVFNVVCGGAHRNWSFNPLSILDAASGMIEMQGGTFIWTKASKLFYQSTAPGDGYKRINSGGHGREIKTMALLEDGDLQLFATGAEDTDIKIFAYENGASNYPATTTNDSDDIKSNGTNGETKNKHQCSTSKGFRCLQTLRKHNTGIQHLQFLTHPAASTEQSNNRTSLLLSSGGCEEFHIWTVNAQVAPSNRPGDLEVGVVCTSTHPRSGKSDLRITGFEATSRQDVIEVQMAYSDSTLKIWTCDVQTTEWSLLREGDYLAACLTGVFRLPASPESQTSNLITTSTDGHLALWPHASPETEPHGALQWASRIKVHQNSILASATHSFENGTRLVITGGDDNAVGFTIFSASSKDTKTYTISRAHAATVTGLAVHPLTSSSVLVLSVGLDQRVRAWEVSAEDSELKVKRRRNVGTSVADAADMALCRLSDRQTGVVVAGVGMEVWRL